MSKNNITLLLSIMLSTIIFTAPLKNTTPYYQNPLNNTYNNIATTKDSDTAYTPYYSSCKPQSNLLNITEVLGLLIHSSIY